MVDLEIFDRCSRNNAGALFVLIFAPKIRFTSKILKTSDANFMMNVRVMIFGVRDAELYVLILKGRNVANHLTCHPCTHTLVNVLHTKTVCVLVSSHSTIAKNLLFNAIHSLQRFTITTITENFNDAFYRSLAQVA